MMPRFVFRLAPVLRQRERIEDEKKQLLAEALRALREAETELSALRTRRESIAREVASEHAELDGETLRITYAHLDFLTREIRAADQRVVERTTAAGLAREALVDASKDRKVMDRLRERQHEVFKQEELRLEQRDLDDANARRFARAAREEASR